jgi:hypothetical protein
VDGHLAAQGVEFVDTGAQEAAVEALAEVGRGLEEVGVAFGCGRELLLEDGEEFFGNEDVADLAFLFALDLGGADVEGAGGEVDLGLEEWGVVGAGRGDEFGEAGSGCGGWWAFRA